MKNVPMVPANPKQQEITRMIENRTRPVLGEDTDVWIDRPFTLYTFAVRTLTSMVQVLGYLAKMRGITSIDIYPQIRAYLSAKGADEEKDGNLNVVFDRIIEAHIDDMKNFTAQIQKQNGDVITVLKLKNVDDKNEEKINAQINTAASKDLQDKNAIMVNDNDLPMLVTSYYLAGMFDVLGQLCRESGHVITYNLGDVIEVSVVLRDGEPFFRVLPGVCAKLTIKQDSFTEEG